MLIDLLLALGIAAAACVLSWLCSGDLPPAPLASLDRLASLVEAKKAGSAQ